MLVIKSDPKSYDPISRAAGLFIVLSLVAVSFIALAARSPDPASALTTVPTRMNFQGRLADSTGNIKPNGTYNLRLRLYTAASGGTPVWTEDRLVAAGNGITLTNGLFSLQLGSVTSLPASLFASGPLYLEVELPTPATATSTSPSWTEGAMTPRNQMATSAYAYNSETLDGLDSSDFAAATGGTGYIQNTTSPQTANFNVTGSGAIGGALAVTGATTLSGGLTVSNPTVNLNVMSAYQAEGSIRIGRTDGTGRYHEIQAYNDNLPATNTLTFSVHNGTIGSTTDALTLYGNGNASIAGALQAAGAIQGTQLISTVATGTAPLAVTSTTKVASLNVDLLDGLDSTSFAPAAGSVNYIHLQGSSPGAAQAGNMNITGAVVANSFSGSGSGLTNLSASNLTSGTIASARVSGAYSGITGVGTLSSLAVSGNATVGGSLLQSGYGVADAATDNMVVNGEFERNNTSGWTGVTGVVTGGYTGNYAARIVGAQTLEGTDFIPVDPTRDVLQLEGYFKKSVTGTTPGILYFGYKAYDANKTVIGTAPCGSYCYFAAAASTIPTDGQWHKYSATTTGEGTAYPKFPVGTKYVRVLALVNYSGSADTETLVDHVSVRRINNGALFVGNNFSATNMIDQHQLTQIYTGADSVLNIATGSGADVNLQGAGLQIGGTNVLTSARVLQNVTANANILTSGTLASARISGSYTGITGVGTLTSLAVSGSATVGGNAVLTSATGIQLQGASPGTAQTGYMNLLGGGIITQSVGTVTGLTVIGKTSPVLADRPVFNAQDHNNNDILTVWHNAGNRVIVRGGSAFWNTAALEVNPAASNAVGLKITGASGQTGQLLRVVDSSNNELFTVGADGSFMGSGNASIGTTSTSAKLQVKGPSNSSYAATATTTYSCAAPYVLFGSGCYFPASGNTPPNCAPYEEPYGNDCYEYSHAATPTGTTYSCPSGGTLSGTTCTVVSTLFLLQNSTSDVFSVDGNGQLTLSFTGTATTNGVCHSGADIDTTGTSRALVACSAAPNDYAEFYPTESNVEAGDIVAITPNMLSYEAQGADPETGIVHSMGMKKISILKKAAIGDSAIGFISTAPYQTIGEDIPASAHRMPVALSGRVPVKVNAEGGAIQVGDQVALSSVPGIATKAYVAGKTFGVALESWDGRSPTVMVYVQSGYYRPDIELLQGSESAMSTLRVTGNAIIGGDLNVSGSTTLTTLVVNGSAEFKGVLVAQDAEFKGTLTVHGHIVSSGATPTVDNLIQSCVEDISISGTDVAGSVRFSVNESECISTDLRLTFAETYSAAPNATLTAKDRTSARLDSSLDASKEKMTFSFDGLQVGKTYRFTYHVIQ